MLCTWHHRPALFYLISAKRPSSSQLLGCFAFAAIKKKKNLEWCLVIAFANPLYPPWQMHMSTHTHTQTLDKTIPYHTIPPPSNHTHTHTHPLRNNLACQDFLLLPYFASLTFFLAAPQPSAFFFLLQIPLLSISLSLSLGRVWRTSGIRIHLFSSQPFCPVPTSNPTSPK